MNNLEDYLPKDKSDFESLILLKKLTHSEFEQLLPELLTWTQDINWPIAPKIIDELLIPLGKDLVPWLKPILLSKEYDWIYTVLWYLVRKLEKEVIYELKDEFVLLSQTKDVNFIEFEIPDMAKEILLSIHN
ncbi:hypothetical protein D3C76_602700 [compost metagenome]